MSGRSTNKRHTDCITAQENAHFLNFHNLNTCYIYLDKTQITLNFFPSSSILYSVIVFIFPLMVSLGGGSVPDKRTRSQVRPQENEPERQIKLFSLC